MSAPSQRFPIVGEIPTPHGPEDYAQTDDQLLEQQISNYHGERTEKEIFKYLLHPDDAYTPEGVYWADLPFSQQLSFINKVNNEETATEWRNFVTMFKNDPLEPIRWYFKHCVLPGAGLGLEGYVLFSIGNVSSLFSSVWPSCWKTFEVCDSNWISAVTYLEIVGIMVGQVLVGLIGDAVGRRWGLIQDAVIMFIGLLMLTACWGTSLNGWIICYAWSLFFYSIGVGGEYPMTATSSMEKNTMSILSSKEDRLHRGRKVQLAFLMQGWGQFLNQVFLILLLIVFHHGSGNPPYSAVAAQWTFRVAFAIPAVGTLWLAYYRTYKMPAASKELEGFKKKSNVTGYDIESLRLTVRYFGPRLLATSGAWFCNDVFFYGNKLFQGKFINVISPGSKGVMLNWLYNLINIGVSLAGYYLAAFLIDHKLYGRSRMQQVGFIMDFILFVIPAFHFKHYQEKAHIKEFQTMYYLSSFFNQFGPNAVTFLVAAEVFPTPIRASAHGFSAAWGKAGALLASVLYNYIKDQTKFYFVPWFGLAGMLLTLLFLPDTTGLDLREQDRRWKYILDGREQEYHGIAIHPRHLSLYERWTGVGKNYDPELDYKQKMEELRADWMQRQQEKASLDSDTENSEPHPLDNDLTPEVHHYFVQTSPNIVPEGRGVDEKLALPEAAKPQ